MSLEEILDEIIDALEELDKQSIDYAKKSSLLSVLDKLIICYRDKSQNADSQELDNACWHITYANSQVYSKKALAILEEIYQFTVALIHKNIIPNSEESEERNFCI